MSINMKVAFDPISVCGRGRLFLVSLLRFLSSDVCACARVILVTSKVHACVYTSHSCTYECMHVGAHMCLEGTGSTDQSRLFHLFIIL